MGTSGAYTGAGGKAGKEIGQGLSDWLDSLPSRSNGGDSTPNSDGTEEGNKPVIQLPPKVVSGLMGLLRPRSTSGGSSDGPGTGGGSIATGGRSTPGRSDRTRAGSGRSSQRLATVGGLAAAGAYAYASRDAAGLRSLGLDYGELRGLDDPFEVTRRIVDAVCGQQADSSLEEAEERYVAASVADWVLQQSEDGELPDVDEVADVAEDELRDAAMVLARQTELSSSGPTEDELAKAIEEGLEKLRSIYGGGS